MSTGYDSRLKRLAGYGAIGATGIPVDLAVVWATALAGLPALAASIVGYQVAVTWNYAWQRRLVFGSTRSVLREFGEYVLADLAGGLMRVGVVTGLLVTGSLTPAVSRTRVPAAVLASAVGIAAAFLVTFALADHYVFNTSEIDA